MMFTRANTNFSLLFPPNRFGGALVTEFLEPPPGRSFCFRQTYRLKPTVGVDNADYERINAALHHPSGPPLHFYPFQNEYFRVVQGRMCVEIDGVLRTLTSEDEEVVGRAGTIHRFYIAPDSTEDMIIILSASDNGMDYQLDRVFFENWYGIWHDYLVHEGKFDLIQLLCVKFPLSTSEVCI
jgi:mannose-6-phosphate isomerase-like protein (cupin superfamily)